MRRAILVGSLIAFPLLCSAQAPCDLELVHQTDPKDGDGYKKRENDRCEGVYLQNVSSTVGDLLVASLTVSEGLRQWPVDGGLTLRWKQSISGDAHIQAFPLIPRKHFRLDVLTGAVPPYKWNTNLVAKYLNPSETGLVAWTTATINGQTERVYLPISLGASATPTGVYLLTVVPPVELSEVYITVASIGSGETPLRNHIPLKYGLYLANQKIEVDLPPFPKAGLYRIELVGDRKDLGSVATPPFLINHVQ